MTDFPTMALSVTHELTQWADAISHWDEHWDTWRAENGEWSVKVGSDAQSMALSTPFTIDHEIQWRGL